MWWGGTSVPLLAPLISCGNRNDYGHSVILSDFHCVGVSGLLQSVCRPRDAIWFPKSMTNKMIYKVYFCARLRIFWALWVYFDAKSFPTPLSLLNYPDPLSNVSFCPTSPIRLTLQRLTNVQSSFGKCYTWLDLKKTKGPHIKFMSSLYNSYLERPFLYPFMLNKATKFAT